MPELHEGLWDELPTKFDTGIFQIGLDLIAKQPIDKRKAFLSAMNILGYGGNRFMPADGPNDVIVMGSTPFFASVMPSEADIRAAMTASQGFAGPDPRGASWWTTAMALAKSVIAWLAVNWV